jgi:hypothetical protein
MDHTCHSVTRRAFIATTIAAAAAVSRPWTGATEDRGTSSFFSVQAEAAGVRTLVLSHLVPADDSEVTDGMWIEAAQSHFGGTVIVGRDLLEI